MTEPADDFVGVYERPTCARCGEPIEQPTTGRPRRYCSTTCRTAGHRHGDPCPRGRTGPRRLSWCWHPPRRRGTWL